MNLFFLSIEFWIALAIHQCITVCPSLSVAPFLHLLHGFYILRNQDSEVLFFFRFARDP